MMGARGLIIGASRSGEGKTSLAIGLMRAFSRRGLRVQGVKSGPDYIDPGFHAAATGRPGFNLDSWAMEPQLLSHLLHDACASADLVLIEGAMGLFDGIPAERNRTGSGADLARLLSVPVLLTMDVSGQAQTAAALAKGFSVFDPDVRIGAVVLNKVASERHKTMATDAIAGVGLPVAGAIMRNSVPILSERHLGLVQASEYPALEAYIERLADAVEAAIDLDALLQIAAPLDVAPGSTEASLAPPGQRIALAKDEAFTFLYPHVVNFWWSCGAEIIPFSPLRNEAPPADCDICWLPGGYPELHAGKLAAAHEFIDGLRCFAETKPVHGECGGYMVLGDVLEDADGVIHRMAGLLGHSTSFAKRKMALGYRQAHLEEDCLLGLKGEVIRGHEFHYASVSAVDSDLPFADLKDGQGRPLGASGGRRGNVSGTFFHAIAKAG